MKYQLLTLMWVLIVVTTMSILIHAQSHRLRRDHKFNPQKCSELNEFIPIRSQIQAMRPQVTEIVNYLLDGPGKGTTWEELALFCDTFGPRMSGSSSLESAISYLRDKMLASGLNVSEESAMIPNWEVLSQSCEISAPVRHAMNILTLGNSVSTNGSLEAEAVVVSSFSDLDKAGLAGLLKGKIVVYNYVFTSYGESVKYRTTGAQKAARYGAVAALVRSVTPFSINSPHAGASIKSIPTAAITVEDANLIERWTKRGKKVIIKMNLETQQHPDVESHNLIGDIPGSSHPRDIVFVSGHMDSWYNTAGAMDDGGGMMISYKALEVLNKLKFRANRTMRAILWTAEEPGLIGARQYFAAHKNDLDSFKAVIESDEGTFRPIGLGYKNVGKIGQCALLEILSVATARVSNLSVTDKYEGSDIEYFSDAGVPGLSLLNENSRYFDFHHTSGDTMDVEDPDALDRGAALFASTLYVLANLDINLRE